MANVNINSNTTDMSHCSKMPNLVTKPEGEENGIKNVIVNSRRIGTKYRIRLTKSENGGFGFKIAERDNMFGKNRPIYITAITTTGSAYRDGRLKEGDMLLEVNGIDLSGKSQPEVTRMLKSVGFKESVEFVVSRQEDHHVNNDYVNIDQEQHDQIERRIDNIFNVPRKDGPGTYVYDIPLNQSKSAGLGLYLKYPTQDGKGLGIWIANVITGGAAWKDGRLQPDDQILAVNGINLVNLSNTDATNTLMAAVSRNLGPEASSGTIRLSINRRDPLVVSRILHGNNSRIRYSDHQPNNKHDKSHSSLNDNSGSNKSSNQNSQEDSALSPQTQASNSLKLSNSGSDKNDQNSSEQTNDTSSAVSQITDFTTMDFSNGDNQNAFTLPKTLELTESNQSVDPASIQSWDDESIDNINGEERFQRDGFGRQSISEKRHAQLMAKNTDTYKRNQKLKEERERQRQLEEQMARHCLDDCERNNSNFIDRNQNQRIANSVTIENFDSNHNQNYVQIHSNNDELRPDALNHGTHREVPVDVQIPIKPGLRSDQSHNNIFGNNQNVIRDYNESHPRSDRYMTTAFNQNERIPNQAVQQFNRCIKCGSDGSCICRTTSLGRPQLHQGYDNPALKRSNSMESIQHQAPIHDGLIIPRAGTVRVARNRKINESFRAAVDRSYEGSVNESTYVDNDIRSNNSAKVTNSIGNSTSSTSNDERLLIGGSNGKNVTAHKKSSSLLTRFLKFGSMKKDKKKNKDEQQISNTKVSREISNRNSEANRSQASKYSNYRMHQSQSQHNVRSSYNQECRQHQLSPQRKMEDLDRQLQGQPMKHQTLQKPRQAQVSIQNPHRASMHLYQYQPVTNSQSHLMAHPKYEANVPARAANLMNSQFQQVRVHHQAPLPLPLEQLQQQQAHQQLPVDILNHPMQYQPIVSRNHIIHQNPSVGLPNGHHPPQLWQSPPIHTPNGLWVANSPVSDNQFLSNNIYGSHTQHVGQFHNQQPSTNIPQSAPFVSLMNGHNNSNGGMLHQSPILQGHISTMTQQHLHNQQPQHIYYYDF